MSGSQLKPPALPGDTITVGAQQITVTATASDGRTGTGQTAITVAPIVVAVAAGNTQPIIAEAVLFVATATPNNAVRRYDWSFGDGKTHQTTSNSVSHAYETDGPKVVTVNKVTAAGNQCCVTNGASS